MVLGDTDLPPGPISGGSMVTASVIPAIARGRRQGRANSLLAAAAKVPNSPFAGRNAADLAFTAGRVHAKADGAPSGTPFEQFLRMGNLRALSGVGCSEGTFGTEAKPKLSSHSFGAHFRRGHLAAGDRPAARQPRRLRHRCRPHPQPARGTQSDRGRGGDGHRHGAVRGDLLRPRNGAPINSNLADYIVAANADVPALEVHFIEYPDTNLNELGARGIGEIGLAGMAAAIAGAVYHATGVRVRELPIKIENLMV